MSHANHRSFSVCYLVDLLAAFLAPDLAATIHAVVGAPVPAIAEISMVFYLLIIGVKTIKPDQNIDTVGEVGQTASGC